MIGLTLLVGYLVGKLQVSLTTGANTSSPNTLTTLTVIRYLLMGVVAHRS